MNPCLCHKFLDISIIPVGLNPIEANKPLGIFTAQFKQDKQQGEALLRNLQDLKGNSTSAIQ
jgi:hypothetical protein